MRSTLDQASIRSLVQKASAQRALPGVHLDVTPFEEEESILCMSYIVKVRANGFMICAPELPEVHAALGEDMFGGDPPLSTLVSVEFETLRGRAVGPGEMLLIDLNWEAAARLSAPPARKGPASSRPALLQFQKDDQICRPQKDSVMVIAAEWVGEMDPDTGQEYLTGEELLDEDLPELVAGPTVPKGPGTSTQQVAPEPQEDRASLTRRVAELEALLKAQQPRVGTVQVPALPQTLGTRTPALFSQNEAQLTDAQLHRLQQFAGTPPPRIARAEAKRSAALQTPQALTDFRDIEQEAVEAEAAEPSGLAPVSQNLTLEQIMLQQLQQNQLLLQRLVEKPTDPVLGALSSGGGDSGSGGSGGTGVKGCLARDAYLKTVTDLAKVAEVARTNALKELGMSRAREDPSLMRRYIERRVPLADNRLLAQFGTMLAEAWAVGSASDNVELLGVTARMMFFLEQCAIDSGKSQLAWLLSGWQEPSMHLLVNRQKQPGLQPFSRLCAPAWVSGNLAYLRDLDYIESRMSSSSKNQPRHANPEDPDPKPKARQRSRKAKEREMQRSPAAQTQTDRCSQAACHHLRLLHSSIVQVAGLKLKLVMFLFQKVSLTLVRPIQFFQFLI